MIKLNEEIELTGILTSTRIISNNLIFASLKTDDGEIQIYFNDISSNSLELNKKIKIFGVVKQKLINKYEFEIEVKSFIYC
jgi:OB-fold nucleic acid binding domain|nr:MAG TPA: hypothetical protein [Caudoviricetes sp.]